MKTGKRINQILYTISQSLVFICQNLARGFRRAHSPMSPETRARLLYTGNSRCRPGQVRSFADWV